MWLLDNRTPFAAERTWVRDEKGAEVWIVAVKASFVIGKDGRQSLDAEQSEVSLVPKFRGSPEASSLLCESDLVHKKARTDVIVQGHAVSPDANPAASVDVRLKVATIDKTLRVYGDRIIKRGFLGLRLSGPEPFTRMPITYERAFGGTDQKDENPKRHRWEPRNPVGVGFGTQRGHVVGMLAPNIEDPRRPYHSWRRGKPAGFGPTARHWLPRVNLAGTYDKHWEETRKPLLPSDFDEHFYQCAPEDQQVNGFLKGGEVVELSNMTPDGHLTFRLPRVTFGMTTHFYDGTQDQHRAVLHTLILQPDKLGFQMVWHSQLPCHQKVNKLKVTQIVLKKRINVSGAELDSGMWIGE